MTPEELELLGATLDWCSRRDRARSAMAHRMRMLLACPELAAPPPVLIKVAGTNGKGSVAVMLEAALGAAGLTTGAFCSPHLVSLTERIRIGGRPISFEQLAWAVDEVIPRLRRLIGNDTSRAQGPNLIPSFFEVLLVVAFELFAEHGVTAAIIEAGVGGTNDATSLLPGELAVITSVDMDHCDRLGDTIEAIARDKAGIAIPDRPLVLGPGVGPEARGLIVAAVAATGAEIRSAERRRVQLLDHDLDGSRVAVATGPGTLLELRLPLAGRFQLDNLATTATAIEALADLNHLADLGHLADLRCLRGIESTTWPGRLEHLPGEPSWVLDVAHNPEGIRALATSLDELIPREDRLVLLGSSKDEALPEGSLDPGLLGDEIWLVDGFYRAVPALELSRRIAPSAAMVRLKGSIEPVLAQLATRAEHRCRVVVITGSVFLVGAARSMLLPDGLPAGVASRRPSS